MGKEDGLRHSDEKKNRKEKDLDQKLVLSPVRLARN